MQKWIPSYIILAILSFALFSACRNTKMNLSKQQEVFLEFGKVESVYRNRQIYYPWELGDFDFSERIPRKEISQDLESIKKQIVKGIRITDEFQYKAKIHFPHSLKYQKLSSGIYEVQAKIHIPEKIEKFSFTKKEIGKMKHFEGIEMTLLSLEGNEAYLLIKDNNIKYDYDYTQDIRQVFEEESAEEEEAPKEIASSQYRNAYELSSWGMSYSTQEDGSLFIECNQIQTSVYAGKGELLAFDSFMEDFRHCLWYRTRDVVYPELLPYFTKIKKEYQEMEKNPDHKYPPIFVTKIRASGKIDTLDFFLYSQKTKEETLNLGKLSRENTSTFEPQQKDFLAFSPLEYKNYTAEELKKKIKVFPYSASLDGNIILCAAFPATENAQDILENELFLENIQLLPKQEIQAEIIESSLDSLETVFMNHAYFRGTPVYLLPIQKSVKEVEGKIVFSYPKYDIKEYSTDSLPKGMRYQNRKLIGTEELDFSLFHPGKFLAYDKEGKLALMRVLSKEKESQRFILEYDRDIKTFKIITLSEEKEEGEFEFKIPLKKVTL